MKTSSGKKKPKSLEAVLALVEIEMAALATNIAIERRQLVAARRSARHHHEPARAA
jgi:hypothetical protein